MAPFSSPVWLNSPFLKRVHLLVWSAETHQAGRIQLFLPLSRLQSRGPAPVALWPWVLPAHVKARSSLWNKRHHMPGRKTLQHHRTWLRLRTRHRLPPNPARHGAALPGPCGAARKSPLLFSELWCTTVTNAQRALHPGLNLSCPVEFELTSLYRRITQ